MTPLPATLLVLACLAVSGCSDRVVRSVVIDNGQMHPHEIKVPANTPFQLTASQIGPKAASLSSPDLGITSLDVPATWISTISPRGNALPGDLKKARAEIGPLPPGRYEITCDCERLGQKVIVVSD